MVKAREKLRAPAAPSAGTTLPVECAVTHRRLLDAAGAVFAEVGYERAHVRDICARAHANIAAIKYHFGGKYPLYEAAIGYWFDREGHEFAAADRPAAGAAPDGPADLRAFVEVFVNRLLDRKKPAWHARLMAREMVEPTGVLDKMVEQSIRPTLVHLRRIIRQIVGPACPTIVVERAMLSVISQCVFYVHARPVMERVFPLHATEPDLAAIADHVATFSIAGVRAICRNVKPATSRAKGRAS